MEDNQIHIFKPVDDLMIDELNYELDWIGFSFLKFETTLDVELRRLQIDMITKQYDYIEKRHYLLYMENISKTSKGGVHD